MTIFRRFGHYSGARFFAGTTFDFNLAPILTLAGGIFFFLSSVAHADIHQRNLGARYSPLNEINRANVSSLELAWQYHTGDLEEGEGITSFQDSPQIVEGSLIVCSVTRRVIALDPETGEERWVYDPQDSGGANKCRGVSAWVDPLAGESQQCATRLFLGTYDYRLVAIDAKSGKPCKGFGENGVVEMQPDKPVLYPGEVTALSRPAVVNGVVVVGSSVTDNMRADAPSGQVLAFDARTGEQRWVFDPVPRHPGDPAYASWKNSSADARGGGNVWSGMVVDEKLDMVYLPTTSPSLDFYGGDRPGDNLYTDSVVALRGATGEVAWHFQIVHHDIWDYDLPTPGLLVDYPHNGKMVPALVQNTKQGLIYIFNRETGEPLVPIEERLVPQRGQVPGEKLSPTQPFSVGMPAVAPQSFSLEDVWGFTPLDKWLCKREAEKLLYGPIYTPPSEQGTIYQPSPSGGPDWGGGAYDPDSHVMVVPANTVPMIVTNTPKENLAEMPGDMGNMQDGFIFKNAGVAYVTKIKPFLSPLGAPCSKPPWAQLTAVDLVAKKIVWQVPLGSIEKLAPVPLDWALGTPGVGAPLITGGGLVFIGYSLDHRFRAFDMETGEIAWSTELPAPANSVPVTYEVNGKQYVVVPAGGHTMWATELSDSVMAYRLP